MSFTILNTLKNYFILFFTIELNYAFQHKSQFCDYSCWSVSLLREEIPRNVIFPLGQMRCPHRPSVCLASTIKFIKWGGRACRAN